MSEHRARIPHNKWIICGGAGVVLLLWAIWQIVPFVRQMLNGQFTIVH